MNFKSNKHLEGNKSKTKTPQTMHLYGTACEYNKYDSRRINNKKILNKRKVMKDKFSKY